MPLTVSVSQQPSNQTSFELGTATFSTAGTPSSAATLTYQWQRGTNNTSYSNVVGATGGEYSIVPVLTDSGSWFRCVITATGQGNVTASATSNGAQLSSLADPFYKFAYNGESGTVRRTRLVAIGQV